MKKFTLGLDIGITSVGWAVMNQEDNSLVDFGVRKFEEAKAAGDARLKRSSRRGNRRKKWRLNQLKEAFYDFGLLEGELARVDNGKPNFKEGYLAFTANHKAGNLDVSLEPMKDRSVYHLRKRALNEEVSTRELLMALYNICKTRGHFLLESVDFSRGNIELGDFESLFYELTDQFVTIVDKDSFTEEVLKKLFLTKMKSTEIKNVLKKQYVDCSEDEKADDRLLNFVLITQGYKGDLVKIGEVAMIEDKPKHSVNIIDLKKKDDLTEFLFKLVSLNDVLMTSRILSKYSYICEKHVDEIDRVMDVLEKMKKEDPDKYKKEKRAIQNNMKMKAAVIGDKLRVVKNIVNHYPNGLYQKEVEDILIKQSQFNSKITNEFIEVCKMIVRARIPYYMGPLSEKAKNSWISRKDGRIKYSYEYALKQEMFNVPESVKRWKEAMISRCTYLPGEFALPKGSFTSELFNVLNELNILKAATEDTYYLTRADKFKVINQLFLQKKEVLFSEVAELLDLNYFGTRSNTRNRFNSKFTIYHQIAQIVPSCKVSSVEEILKDYSIANKIDEIILSLNLYDDEQSKFDYFYNTMKFDESSAKKLAKLNCTGFTSLSKKFIFDIPMDGEKNTLIEKLLEDNSMDKSNDAQSIITHACDADGVLYLYDSNKYKMLLKENPTLGIHLLLDENKPLIPIARPVVRGLNETFKVYNSIVDLYGYPDKVVIETARELKDSKRNGEEPAKHFVKMEKCVDHLRAQCKEINSICHIDNDEVVLDFLKKESKKVELYIRQNGQCMISGNTINLNELHNYEIDHILPRGFGDNSMNNLILIEKSINSAKGDRVPLEFIRSKHGEFSESSYIKRVKDLFKMKLISEEKVKRLFLEDQDSALGFVQRNLVDTRYIIKEFTSILSAYNEGKGAKTNIISLQGSYNAPYRKAFKMPKNRDVGHQHHAHDAAIIIVVDKVLNHICPNYQSREGVGEYKKLMLGFRKEEEKAKKDHERAKKSFDATQFFILNIYRKAFKINDGGKDFMQQVKEKTPLFSNKVQRKYTGGLFNATIYPQDENRKKSPLDIVGVNDDKKVFSSIECVAVDFYKVTLPNGKKKHCAVHIPKVIVGSNGQINKEKYLSLIQEHYQYKELIDEEGNLIEGYFRLRMFKGDLFYDTERKQPMIYEIGSIVDKVLQISYINMYSFEVLNRKKDVLRKKFYDLDKEQQGNKNHLIDLILSADEFKFDEKDPKAADKRKSFEEKVKDCFDDEKLVKSFFSAVDWACYLHKVSENYFLPPSIIGQNRTTVNNVKGDDTQYVKIATSPLGIRYTLKENHLTIQGPNDFNKFNKYKLIKKEKFCWTI